MPRPFICFIILAVAVSAGGLSATADKPVGQSDQTKDKLHANHVLKELLAGNERFIKGKSQHPHESAIWRSKIESEQHPKAVILGCADSRVPPEIVFDQGLGDLFVIRVAGNIVDNDVIASIEYAVDHLGVELVVVLGHTQCGAVTCAYDMHNHPEETDEIKSLLYRIRPALAGIDKDADRKSQIDEGIRRNVERSVRTLRQVPDLIKSLKEEHDLRVVGAVYDLHSGRVMLTKQLKDKAAEQVAAKR